MAKDKKLNLEATLSQLELTIEKLDDEQATLADSLAAFEAGLKLIRTAQKELQDAEQRVVKLMEEDGEPKPERFVDENVE